METRIVKNEGYHCYGIHRPTSTNGYKKYTLKGLFSLLENHGTVHEFQGDGGFHVISKGNDYFFDAVILSDLVLFGRDRNKRKREYLEQKV